MRMKNKPLYVQLTILFSILIIFVGLALVTIIPSTLKSFFTDEIYNTIEESQLTVDIPTNSRHGHMGRGHGMGMHMMQQNFRSAEHIFINSEGTVLSRTEFSTDVLNHFFKKSLDQKSSSERYEMDVGDKVMLYVIAKKQAENGEEVFQISYMWDTYRKELSATLLKKMYVILLVVSFAALALALFFAKRIVKPIKYMTDSVAQIANKNWDKKLTLNRSDELGTLANSIDYMRVQLKKQDETEKTILQQISHDLKTPVMVIRSYAEAMRDGLYPTGSLEGTADVIDKEAKNLEKKVKDLLLITKLDYLADKKLTKKPLQINKIINGVISRLQPYRTDIKIEKAIEPLQMSGNEEQLTIMVENLLDNALKYADKQIKLTTFLDGNYYVIKCQNDGAVIDNKTIEKVFQPFVKGKSGNFGLGLTIMKRIAELHDGTISFDVDEGETVVEIKLAR